MGHIYVLRHGQTVANRDRRIQGPRIDAELSDLGHRQADRVAQAMSDLHIQALYSSPLLRARQTAHAVATAHHARHVPAPTISPPTLGAAQAPRPETAFAAATVEPNAAVSTPSPVPHAAPASHSSHAGHDAHAAQTLAMQVVPELYEMDYGLFTGRTYDDVADEMEQVIDAWRMGFVDEPFPGGESPVLARHRLRPFMSRLVAQAEGGDVAVVAHGRINRVLIASLTGAGLTRLEEFPQSNAAITQLEVQAGKAVVRRLNDTSHLDVTSDAFS